jgi:hypothetical protein
MSSIVAQNGHHNEKASGPLVTLTQISSKEQKAPDDAGAFDFHHKGQQ